MAYEIGYVDDAGSEGIAHWQMLKVIKTLAEANGWVTQRYTTPTDGSSRELILKGVGLSGTDEIYIGFRSYHDVSADYYNLASACFLGYIAGNPWAFQPGFVESGIPAHNQRVDYWLQVNAQRINLGLKIANPVYTSGGAGKFMPLGTPGQYPLPLYCAGMLNGASATRYSDTAMSMPWKGSRANFQVRGKSGAWATPATHPWNNAWIGGASAQLRDTNDQYPIGRVQICDAPNGIYGWLDGIGYVSNFNNTVESVVQEGGTPVTDDPAWTPAERAAAIVTAGGTPWVCIQDTYRTSFNDYFALELN